MLISIKKKLFDNLHVVLSKFKIRELIWEKTVSQNTLVKFAVKKT